MKSLGVLMVCQDMQQFAAFQEAASGLPIRWHYAKTTAEADQAIAEFRPQGVIWLPGDLAEVSVWTPTAPGLSLTILRSEAMARLLTSDDVRSSVRALLEETCHELKVR